MLYAIIYAVLLVLSQWFYIVAMSTVNVGVCATVYSLGFIIPTLYGVMFCNEKISFLDSIGIICIILAIIILSYEKTLAKKGNEKYLLKKLFMSAGVGICYGGCNLLSTTLVGLIGSIIFFSTYNISVIFLSILSGIIIFKEKIRKKDAAVFILGCFAIFLLNF